MKIILRVDDFTLYDLKSADGLVIRETADKRAVLCSVRYRPAILEGDIDDPAKAAAQPEVDAAVLTLLPGVECGYECIETFCQAIESEYKICDLRAVIHAWETGARQKELAAAAAGT